MIERCYYKSFGKNRPDNVRSIERMAREQKQKKEEKKKRKQEPRTVDQSGVEAPEATGFAAATDLVSDPHDIPEDELPF